MKLLDKVNTHKKELLIALENTLGIVSDACKKAKISRSTFYNYYNQDKQFKSDVDDINDIALDFAESKLHKLIESENVTAIIFYLKTKGRKRGYSEKLEIEQNNKTEGHIIQTEPLSMEQWLKMGEASQAMINKAHLQLTNKHE